MLFEYSSHNPYAIALVVSKGLSQGESYHLIHSLSNKAAVYMYIINPEISKFLLKKIELVNLLYICLSILLVQGDPGGS